MNFLPERTIQYKTYAKQTLIDGLTPVFRNHPDELLHRTKVAIEFPKTEADFPAVIVKFYEREIMNAGVGHREHVLFAGESDSIEVQAKIVGQGSVSLQWPAVDTASHYRVYKGGASDGEVEMFEVSDTQFLDNGATGFIRAPGLVTGALDSPTPTVVVNSFGELGPGTYFYRVTALEPTQAVKFKHYFYRAEVEFEIQALSAFDRDLVADTLVQTLAMGPLEAYTASLLERIYPDNDLYPYSQFHFINLNTDQIETSTENQVATPWGAEDDLLYSVSYRIGVFGELYSLPPKLTYNIVKHILLYPSLQGFPPNLPPPGTVPNWVSNSL